ncbi:MAG: Imidazolonepropionase [Phycisphaerae bacterium]|nr:Imidazolonepropionase [Phycisphaerae bacterium]
MTFKQQRRVTRSGRGGNSRSGRLPAPAYFIVLLGTASVTASAHAQLFGLGGGETIEHARILTGDGRVIEQGGISIRGDRIGDVGADVKAGILGKSFDATGKTVTPGFIDVYSGLGIISGGGAANALSKAADGWDAYAADVFEDALRNGVTTVYVAPRGPVGVLGTSAIFSLGRPGGGRTGSAIKEDVALHVNLGSGQSALARINTFNNLRRQFREALEHRKSLEDYKADLEEYEKKIKERAEKKAKEEAEKAKSGGEKKEADPKPSEKKDEKPAEPKPDAPKPEGPRPGPRPGPPRPSPGGADGGADAPEDATGEAPSDEPVKVFRSLISGDDAPFADAPPATGAAGDAKKEEEIKKPAEPKPDRAKEVLLKALDRKLPVRIEAHRSEDILNALELAQEFNLDLILEGATEAYLVADEIAKAKAPVALGPAQRSELRADNEFRRHLATSAARLSRAGVRWAVGGGGGVQESRFVLANAQLTVGALETEGSPLELVTTRAARFLGLEGAGRVARGARADLIVWSGDPHDPSSVVERAYVGGKVVYEAKADK